MSFDIKVKHGPFFHDEDNWQAIGFLIELTFNGKPVLETTYKMGLGHVKIPKRKPYKLYLSTDETNIFEALASHGVGCRFADWAQKLVPETFVKLAKYQKLQPSKDDVLSSLLLDGSPAFDCQTFSDWCSDFGYDTDSISAKNMYDTCLSTGQRMAGAAGLQEIENLREKYSDY